MLLLQLHIQHLGYHKILCHLKYLNFQFCRSTLTTWAEVALLVTLAASAAHALLSRLLPPFYQRDIVLSEAQMRLMHIDPKNHPGFKGGGISAWCQMLRILDTLAVADTVEHFLCYLQFKGGIESLL